MQYSEKICPENPADVEKILAGDKSTTVSLMVRFFAFLYGHKFSSSFERGEILSLVVDTETKTYMPGCNSEKDLAQNDILAQYVAIVTCSRVALKKAFICIMLECKCRQTALEAL